MAETGWTTRVTTAAGVAAGTGAAQLGLGYGLGVVVWPMTGTPDESVWLGSLGWATWITASATVFGAVIGSRLGGARATRSRGPWRLALAISAGLGALVAVALIALPARSAVRVDTLSPSMVAAGYALVGLVLGVAVAYWAVLSRPVAANLIATAAWLWGLAVAAVAVDLTAHRTSATYLTSWQFAEVAAIGKYGAIYWPSALLTLGAAVVIGVVAATPAVLRGNLGLGTATSGAVGPLLVAASFLALSPRLTGSLGPIESAYLIAPYAVLAGLGGSALTAAVGQAVANRRGRQVAVATPDEDADFTPAALPAAVPAADSGDGPATAAGRAKLPAQPKSPVEPPVVKPPTAAPKPADPPKPASMPAGPGTPASPGTPAGRGMPAGPGTPAGRGMPGGPARPPQPGGAEPAIGRSAPTPPAADPEIAEAARPRGRAKKAAPPRKVADAKEPKSTVTPPPTTPPIAQINPKPSVAD